MRPIILTILLSCSHILQGQGLFSLEEFLSTVKKYHPIAIAAQKNVGIAKASRLSASGVFDPKLAASSAGKNFEQIDYYSEQQFQLNIPAWYGVDVYGGVENSNGSKLNNEVTKGSMSYAGVSLDLVRSFILDKRRTLLKQADLVIRETESERTAILNELLREASVAYWDWWMNTQLLQLAENTLVNAEKRYELVRKACLIGERPPIDTIEALAQVASFQMQKTEAAFNLAKAKLEMSVFLWEENARPYELPESIQPVYVRETVQIDQWQSLLNEHPELKQYEYKLAVAKLDKRLKFQSLFPSITTKYQYLFRRTDWNQFSFQGIFRNDYRYSIGVSIPLRFSEVRGEYRQAGLKLERTRLEMSYKRQSLQVKFEQYWNEWSMLGSQLTLQQQQCNNYDILQRAEEMRFMNGESSLFLVNAREQKNLEARQKLMEIQAKQQKTLAKLKWSAGTLWR